VLCLCRKRACDWRRRTMRWSGNGCRGCVRFGWVLALCDPVGKYLQPSGLFHRRHGDTTSWLKG
jgi:uncharacterized protein YfaT (DUF1175 family)